MSTINDVPVEEHEDDDEFVEGDDGDEGDDDDEALNELEDEGTPLTQLQVNQRSRCNTPIPHSTSLPAIAGTGGSGNNPVSCSMHCPLHYPLPMVSQEDISAAPSAATTQANNGNANGGSSLLVPIVVVVGGLLVAAYLSAESNFLTGLDEGMQLGTVGLQLAFAGFCMTPGVIEGLANKKDKEEFDDHQKDMAETDFANEGNINEDDYEKQSIYSLLYAIYYDIGHVRFRGELYSFRFNTWGLGGTFLEDGSRRGTPDQCAGVLPNGEPATENHLTSYPATVVQRHGKTAYSSLLNFATVKVCLFVCERRDYIYVSWWAGDPGFAVFGNNSIKFHAKACLCSDICFECFCSVFPG